MDDTQDTNIISTVEDEVVEVEESLDDVKPQTDAATTSLSLENLIRGHIATLNRLKNEIAEHTDTLNNILLNDPTYKEHEEAAKKATKVKTATKSEIMKRPDVMQVANKIKEAREESKDQQTTLSELLAEYQRSTGLDSIELDDGKIKRIVMTAKLST